MTSEVTQADWATVSDWEIVAEVSALQHLSPNRNATLIQEMCRRFEVRLAHRGGEVVAANRVVYNLQLGGDRLCDALRKIAGGCDDPVSVANAALNHKAKWVEPPAPPTDEVARLREDNERLDQRETELMAELSGLDQFNAMLVDLVRRAMRLIPEGKSLWWDQANAALSMHAPAKPSENSHERG